MEMITMVSYTVTGKKPRFPASVQAKDMFRIGHLSYKYMAAVMCRTQENFLNIPWYSIGHNFLYLHLTTG